MADILVVDDDPTSLMLIQMILDQSGHTVTTAANGVVALDLFEKGKYALVITDLFMPGLDGFELMTKIRKQAPKQKILAISGYSDEKVSPPNYLRFSGELGADAVLGKPLKVDSLHATVAACLDD